MSIVRMTELQLAADLASVLDRVERGEQIVIERDQHQSVAMISLGDNRAKDPADQYLEMLENFQHQVKTPVFLAHRQARRVFGLLDPSHPAAESLRSLLAQCYRAEQVVGNAKLFADLARGHTIKTNAVLVTPAMLSEKLLSASRDAEMLGRHNDIRFVVDEHSLEVAHSAIVYMDLELLDYIMANVLDNAVKYSEHGATVRVRVGLCRKGRYFFLSIVNKGLPTSSPRCEPPDCSLNPVGCCPRN